MAVQSVIGKSIWKVSLRTLDVVVAEARARQCEQNHNVEIAAARELLKSAEASAKIVAFAESKAAELFGAEHNRALKALYVMRLPKPLVASARAKVNTLSADEREAIEDTGGIEELFYWYFRGRAELQHRRHLAEMRYESGQITKFQLQMELANISVREQDAAVSRQALEKLGLLKSVESDKGPRITEAMETWFHDRKQGDLAIKRHRVAIGRLVALHGDLPVGEITKSMIEQYKGTVSNLTDHRHVPAHRRGSLEIVEGLPKISARTVERHLISIKALLTFCLEREWVTKNVASGIKPPKDDRPIASKRRSMTRDERIRFLNRAIEEYGTDSDRVWLIRLAAYTGCRLEEITQLGRSNIKQVDGVWAVEIDDLDGRVIKGRSSFRAVPLHPAIRDDFLRWLNSRKGERVFMSFKKQGGRYSNQISGDMARLMDRAGLNDPRLVMHSFRHGLKKGMADAGIDGEYRRLILGHRPRDVHDSDYERPSFETIAREFFRMPPLF